MKAIVAMDLNRVIGYKGKIPWKISADFQWFKSMTMGKFLVMGNNTFKMVGSLPFRFTFVLTNDPLKLKSTTTPTYEYVNYELLLKRTKWVESDSIWLCGGESTYKALLPDCNELYITYVIDEFEGDTFFPPHEHLFSKSSIIKETSKYWIVKYEK